ncbi:hypothetical protein KVT40_008491 [Elsinoe batatas]|uniref:Uncharacterized protein n=1 Tax=Elsinoe batatas TaxID=2601811 RepID=A0A8K0KX42_9PEZI|nr:hypothetical protein KVT40_008491 [Elsinoe batatas]
MAASSAKSFATSAASVQVRRTTQTIEHFCRPLDQDEPLRLAFIHCKPGDTEKHPNEHPNEEEQHRLYKVHGLAPWFWQKMPQEASGFFGTRDHPDPSRQKLQYHTSTLRLLIKMAGTMDASDLKHEHKGVPYGWSEIGVFTRWQPDGRVTVLVQCDDRPEIVDAIKQLHLDTFLAQCQKDPYAIHALILDQLVKEFDDSVWSWRKWVREFEKGRKLGIKNLASDDNNESTTKDKESATAVARSPDPDYERMHEVARHIIHCTEMLATAINVVKSVIEEHNIFLEDNEDIMKDAKWDSRNVSKDLRMRKSFLEGFHLRSKALEERLKNEVNLAFAIVSQHDSKVSVQIAEAAQSDSASTKTIQFLGLIFLPSTFICSLFSTSFFTLQPAIDIDGTQGPTNNLGPDKIPTYWMMSERFWIYWAFALPLTAFTVLIWSIWQNYSRLRHPTPSDVVPWLIKLKAMLHPRSAKREAALKAANEIELHGRPPYNAREEV